MKVNQNAQKLSKLLSAFSNVCNVNINIADNNASGYFSGDFLCKGFCRAIQQTEKGRSLCCNSDKCLFEKCKSSKNAEFHICHAGLADLAVPMFFNGEISGFIILGQLRINRDFEEVSDCIKDLGANMEEMKKYYEELPLVDYERLQNILTLATVLAEYIFTGNMFLPAKNNTLERACAYINGNLEKNISIDDLTFNTGTAKSTLYSQFKMFFNCTPGEYISRARLNKSVPMLMCTDYSIEEIAERVGFSSASYYSKVFKKTYGVSPLKYRQSGNLN